MRRTRLGAAVATTTALLGVPTLVPQAAAARADCIEVDQTCYATMATALDAADDGDTIRVPAGTFPGGIVVTKSVTIDGAGAHWTRFHGGGPVITVGEFGDDTPPTVTIRDLTVSGGRTTTSAMSRVLFDQDGVWATGGGIEVPPTSFDFDTGELGTGATVRMVHTVVEDNAVAPLETVPSGLPCPGGEACALALAAGGGIDTSGDLFLEDTVVRDNRVGASSGISSLASDSEGGGIRTWAGTLSLVDSRVEDNSATGVAPNARFAEGGGVFTGAGFFPNASTLSVRHTRISGNTARLDSGLPDEQDGVPLDQAAIGGGLQVTGNVATAVIDHATLSGNSVRATNSAGSATAFAGGLLVDLATDARIAHTTVRENRVSAETLGASTGLAHADTAGLQLHGSISHSRIRDNAVRAVAAAGDAEALAGAMWALEVDASHVDVRDNRVLAAAPRGSATVRGAGVVVDSIPDPAVGGLSMKRSSVRGNTGAAEGRSTVVQGGGIFDARVSLETGPAGGPLTLAKVRIEANRLAPAVSAAGGGLFVDDQQLALHRVLIRANDPDDCVGCDGAAARTSTGPRPGARPAAPSVRHGLALTPLPRAPVGAVSPRRPRRRRASRRR